MFFFAVFFISNRIGEILILIPTVGMLAWFVDGYQAANSLTPTPILLLFIVSTLALAWAFFTLFSYHRSSNNARFVALVDIGFFGAFIAAVYQLRGIASADCTNFNFSLTSDDGLNVDLRTEKRCAMLKASFAFGIILTILFFVTAITAFLHGGGWGAYDYDRSSRHYHSDRHSHRSRSRSRDRRSYSGSRHSHSHRRVYV